MPDSRKLCSSKKRHTRPILALWWGQTQITPVSENLIRGKNGSMKTMASRSNHSERTVRQSSRDIQRSLLSIVVFLQVSFSRLPCIDGDAFHLNYCASKD